MRGARGGQREERERKKLSCFFLLSSFQHLPWPSLPKALSRERGMWVLGEVGREPPGSKRHQPEQALNDRRSRLGRDQGTGTGNADALEETPAELAEQTEAAGGRRQHRQLPGTQCPLRPCQPSEKGDFAISVMGRHWSVSTRGIT